MSKVRVWADLHKTPVRTIFLSPYPKFVHTSTIKCTWINDVQWLSTIFLGQGHIKSIWKIFVRTIFSPLLALSDWDMLHIKSVCFEHEPSFQVNGECHSRSLKRFWTIFSLSLVKSSSDFTNDCPQVREWSAVTLNHAFMLKFKVTHRTLCKVLIWTKILLLPSVIYAPYCTCRVPVGYI